MLILFTLVITIEVGIIVLYIEKMGWDRFGIQFIRMVAYLFLMSATFVGSKIGKWVLSAWFIFSAALGYYNMTSGNRTLSVLVILFHLSAAVFLQLNKPISGFLYYQKIKRPK